MTGAVTKAPTPGPTPAPAPPPAQAPEATSRNRLSLLGATALVVGSIVGVGMFNLPSSLAPYGPITLVSMGLTTVGALALARLFASLARRMPAPGGPYAYARVAFGNRLGFANAWSYWITAWAGNAAIAVGWVPYVEVFINKGQTKIWTILLVLVGLWVPALVNLSGLRNTGWFQLATTITKFAALVFMSIVGLFYIKSANFHPWNVSGHSAVSAIGSGKLSSLTLRDWRNATGASDNDAAVHLLRPYSASAAGRRWDGARSPSSLARGRSPRLGRGRRAWRRCRAGAS